MATIYNSDCTKGLSQNAGIQQSKESVPNQLADKIVPTFETNPEMLRRANFCINGSISNATSSSLLTTSTTKDTFITGVVMGFTKDVTATSTGFSIRSTLEDGSAAYLLNYGTLTLTAQSGNMQLSIVPPIKLKRNTSITVNSLTNVGNFQSNCSVYGYTVDNSLA